MASNPITSSTPQGGEKPLLKSLKPINWKWTTTLVKTPLPWKTTSEQRTPFWWLCTTVNFTVIPLILVVLAEAVVNAALWMSNKVVTWLNTPPPAQELDEKAKESPIPKHQKTPPTPPEFQTGDESDADDEISDGSEGSPHSPGSVEGDGVLVKQPSSKDLGQPLPGPIVGGSGVHLPSPAGEQGMGDHQLINSYVKLEPNK